jgi:hypothetical protein
MLAMFGVLGVFFAIIFNVGVALNLTKQPHDELTLATATN